MISDESLTFGWGKKEEETSIHLDVFARALKIIDTDESAQSLSLRAVERNVFVFFFFLELFIGFVNLL